MKRVILAAASLAALSANAFAGFTSIGTFGGREFFVSTTGNFFATHENDATSLGLSLASIHSQAEVDFISSQLGTSEYIQIGLTDRDVEGTFAWVDGTPLDFTNWSPSEPNNFLGNEDFTIINWGAGGSWNDIGDTDLYRALATGSAPVPEPATMAIFGVAGIAALGRKRRKNK